jgi:hypothetical protein
MAGRNGVWRGAALKRKVSAQERQQKLFDAETEKLLRVAAQLAKQERKRKL